MAPIRKLSAKSKAILSLIANGYSYSQIVDGGNGFRYPDIFAAAEEALRLNESSSDYAARVAKIKEQYPRAYERWDADEDDELTSLFHEGLSPLRIARHFGRQPSAIRSRLTKLNLDTSKSDDGE